RAPPTWPRRGRGRQRPRGRSKLLVPPRAGLPPASRRRVARAARPTDGGRDLAIARPSISEEGTRVMTAVPKLFRVTLEVSDLEAAAQLYRQLFAVDGTRSRCPPLLRLRRRHRGRNRRIARRVDTDPGTEVAVLRGRRHRCDPSAGCSARRARALPGSRRASRRGRGAPVGRAFLLRGRPVGQRPVFLPERNALHVATASIP